MPHVNYVAVLVATVTIFVLGWLWYSPLMFLKPWLRARGLDPAVEMAGGKMPMGNLVIELLRCFVLAFVFAHLVSGLNVTTLFGPPPFALLLRVGFPVV